MSDDKLSALRHRLVALRGDLLGRLSQELGAGEISLMAGVQAAIIAVDEYRDERKLGDPGRQ